MSVAASIVAHLAALVSLAAQAGAPQSEAHHPRLRPVPAAGQDMKTGPEVGARVPRFELEDQHGRRQSLRSLAGPKGLLLAFVRSADW